MGLDPISSGFDFASAAANFIGKFFVDKTQVEKDAITLQLAALTADASIAASQAATNTEEAKSSSMFVSGWRPFIGWVCGAGFAWKYILLPAMVFGYGLAEQKLPPLPVIDTAELVGLLTGMLGLGGLRTFEKLNGVHAK